MSRKNKDEQLWLYAIVGSNSKRRNAKEREKNQLDCIKEYAKSHNIQIAQIIRKSVHDNEINIRHIDFIADEVTKRHCDGVIVVNMNVVAGNMKDAYSMIGRVVAAGGKFISVEEGKLDLRLKMDRKKKVDKNDLNNEKRE